MHHLSLRRRTGRLAAVIVALLASASLSGCVKVPALGSGGKGVSSIPPTNASAERYFLDSVNSLRAAHHVRALVLNDNLVQKARYWSLWMANGNCGRAANGMPMICHSSLAGGIKVRWTLLEENVGAGSPRTNLAGVANAFAHSKPHLANIVNAKVRYVGIGVAYHANTVYVTEEFMAT